MVLLFSGLIAARSFDLSNSRFDPIEISRSEISRSRCNTPIHRYACERPMTEHVATSDNQPNKFGGVEGTS